MWTVVHGNRREVRVYVHGCSLVDNYGGIL